MARPTKEAAAARDLNIELNLLTGKKIIRDKALDTAYETILTAMTDKDAPAATNLNAAKSMFALAEQVKENLAKNLTESDYGSEKARIAEANQSQATTQPLVSMGQWDTEQTKPN